MTLIYSLNSSFRRREILIKWQQQAVVVLWLEEWLHMMLSTDKLNYPQNGVDKREINVYMQCAYE